MSLSTQEGPSIQIGYPYRNRVVVKAPDGGPGWLVTDLATGATASGTITTNLPALGTLLAPRGWMSVGGTSSVIGIALMGLYIETDY